MTQPAFPHLRTRLVYFGQYASASLAITYWPYYIESLGLSADHVGWMFGARTIVVICAQLLLAQYAERIGARGGLLHVAVLVSFVLALGLPFTVGFWSLMAVMLAMTPSRCTTVPLLDAMTVVHAPTGSFGGIRLWGSIGFGLGAGIFGLATSELSHDAAGRLAIPTYVVVVALVAVVGVTLPRYRTAVPKRAASGVLSLLRQPGLVPFLIFSSLHWGAITIFNIYFPLRAKELDLSTAVPGLAVGLSIAFESLALFLSSRLFGLRRPHWWLAPVMVAGGIRWTVVAFFDDPTILIGIQVLHFMTFGVWYAASMEVLGRFAPPERRPALQGLFMAAVFGGGGVLGSFGGGSLTNHFGTSTTFLVAAALEAAALVGVLVAGPRLFARKA